MNGCLGNHLYHRLTNYNAKSKNCRKHIGFYSILLLTNKNSIEHNVVQGFQFSVSLFLAINVNLNSASSFLACVACNFGMCERVSEDSEGGKIWDCLLKNTIPTCFQSTHFSTHD